MDQLCYLCLEEVSFVFSKTNKPITKKLGQQRPGWDGLRLIGEWVSHNVLKLDIQEGDAWSKKLILEAARRNARMVAGWQAYGFMHGVINTDK